MNIQPINFALNTQLPSGYFHNITGLFHKAVMMGGYFFNPLRLTMKENMTFGAEIAEGLGYSVPDKKDKKKLLSISRKITPEQIVEYRPDRKMNLV